MVSYLLAVCFCMGCSTICHLCYVKNPHICDMVAKLDYWGIAILFLGSAYPQISYKFACGTTMIRARWCFVSLITVCCAICMFLTMKPNFASPKARAGVFLGFAMSFLAPLIFLAIFYNPETSLPPDFGHLALVGGIYAIGTVFYLS